MLEAGDACRTWRLPEIPSPGGPPVAAVELPPHRLAWLDHEAGEVSGDRGFARRVDAGHYDVVTTDADDLPAATHCVITTTTGVVHTTYELVRRAHGWAVSAASPAGHCP